MSEKPNCYECKYQRKIPGDAHSQCRHPELPADNMLESMVKIFSSKNNYGEARKKLNLKGNPHGIQAGWFLWPANFDPVWLESCDGFSQKEAAA